MKKPKAERQTAIAYGYVIADEQGRVQLNTLRSNRSACWYAFIGKFTSVDRDDMKSQGFRAVPVWVREHKGR